MYNNHNHNASMVATREIKIVTNNVQNYIISRSNGDQMVNEDKIN